MNKPKVLFIGNYLNSKKGTTALAVRLKQRLENEVYIYLASGYKNKGVRMLHIMWQAVFNSSRLVVIDVFSGQAFQIARLSAILLSNFTKKKIILMLRGGNLVNFYQQNQAAVQKLFNKAEACFTPSQYLLQEFKPICSEIKLLPNFVDSSLFSFQNREANKYKLLWVRSFKSIYQPQMAIEMLALLRKQNQAITLTMLGPDDGLLTECKQLSEQLELQAYIHYLPALQHHDLPAIYTAHGIFINTTLYESFGNALMEAAASGLPIVTTSVGEIPFIWKHKETAMLLNNGKAAEMAKHVTLLLNDSTLYQKLATNAHMVSLQHDWLAIKDKWLHLFKQYN